MTLSAVVSLIVTDATGYTLASNAGRMPSAAALIARSSTATHRRPERRRVTLHVPQSRALPQACDAAATLE